MVNNALISVGRLCNDGYYVAFKLDNITIVNTKGNAILKGQQRDAITGFWCINLHSEIPKPQSSEANNVYELRHTGAFSELLAQGLFQSNQISITQGCHNSALYNLARSHRRSVKNNKIMGTSLTEYDKESTHHDCVTMRQLVSDVSLSNDESDEEN
jgi:hypothetical protein